MKINIRKTILSVCLTLAISMTAVSAANAVPMFGTVTTSTADWADGTCAWRTTCTATYVMWIKTSSGCTTAQIACI